MISLPDFKEKQILFVDTEWGTSSHLRFENENIVFDKDKEVVNRVSVHKAFAVFIIGDLSLTTRFLKEAKEHGVSVFLLKNNFELYAALATTADGHYLLRMKQYALSDDQMLEMSKLLVSNKIANQRKAILPVVSKDREGELLDAFEKYQVRAGVASANNELLGIEGNASRRYFSEIFGDHQWRRRAPRTKEDSTNLLMDMGYTFLFNFVDSLLRLHGFDTYKGFYHKLFFQRRSLACDLMEPLRYIIDRQIIKSYNLKQIKESDFKFLNGAFELSFKNRAKYAAILLGVIMDNKESIFSYIHGFYCHIMDSDKHVFPEYKPDTM